MSNIFAAVLFGVPAILLILALLIGFDPRRGGGIHGLINVATLRGLLIGAFTIAWFAVLPWVLTASSLTLDRVFVAIAIALMLGGTFVASRQLRPGWAAIVAPALLLLCVWAAGYSTVVAYHSGWQGLEWDDNADGDGPGGTAFGIAIFVYVGTVLAIIPGFALGFASQIGKRKSQLA